MRQRLLEAIAGRRRTAVRDAGFYGIEHPMRELASVPDISLASADTELASASNATATPRVLALQMGLAASYDRTHDAYGNERSLDSSLVGMLRDKLAPADFVQVMHATSEVKTSLTHALQQQLHGRPKDQWIPWTLTQASLLVSIYL